MPDIDWKVVAENRDRQLASIACAVAGYSVKLDDRSLVLGQVRKLRSEYEQLLLENRKNIEWAEKATAKLIEARKQVEDLKKQVKDLQSEAPFYREGAGQAEVPPFSGLEG